DYPVFTQSKVPSNGTSTTEVESSIILQSINSIKPADVEQLKRLSPAEMLVVFWFTRGVTSLEDIGRRLFRSPNTIRTHLNSICHKLHLHSREELLSWLVQNENIVFCNDARTIENHNNAPIIDGDLSTHE
ncbi:MAG: helix-turn-helix transcriptional regulator, partial [Planctomycetes bacterium]|nr:helix-turn-helix transcriptional regulator [Planctomycetota bacterium]